MREGWKGEEEMGEEEAGRDGGEREGSREGRGRGEGGEREREEGEYNNAIHNTLPPFLGQVLYHHECHLVLDPVSGESHMIIIYYHMTVT